jgi:hypothetical protein
MSHFVGVAFIPRDDDYEVNEEYSKKEQNLENMFSMGEALQSDYLTHLLAPYNEQDDEYCEVQPELNETATKLLQAYMNKDKEAVENICNELIERDRGWAERTSKWNDETKSSQKLTLAEIDTQIEPTMMLVRLFNLDMTSEQFDMDNDDHRELFENILINASDFSVNEEYQVFDNYLYNSEGYWDWYEVGGRWDNFFSEDNANNVLEDISLIKGTRMVKRIYTLEWYEAIHLKEEDIENRNLDDKFVKTYAKDDLGKYLEETITDENGNEKTKYIVDEYWTTEELLDEEVEIKKYGFSSMITEQYGWEQESRMGWFGMSEKDNMSDDDKEFTESSWDKLVDERVDEMLKDVDENGICKWVAVAVDFHI